MNKQNQLWYVYGRKIKSNDESCQIRFSWIQQHYQLPGRFRRHPRQRIHRHHPLINSCNCFTFSRTQLETIRRHPLKDGNHTLRLIATDDNGNTSKTFSLNFTLDTAAPQTALLTPIPGGNHSITVRLIGTTTDTTTNLSNLEYSIDGGKLNTLNTESSGQFDFSPLPEPLDIGSHTAIIEATDIVGNKTSQNINFQVTNNFTIVPPETTGWAATSTNTVLLAERNTKLVQAVVPVQLGQTKGSRTLRFQLKADFDKTDTTSAIEDLFQIYLVSPNNPNQTLLDGGSPGTPLFSLAGNKAEFLPGRVRYSGDTVEIDLTSLTNNISGNLLLRLTDSDTDTGSTVEVKNLTNTIDEEGTASPVFVATQNHQQRQSQYRQPDSSPRLKSKLQSSTVKYS